MDSDEGISERIGGNWLGCAQSIVFNPLLLCGTHFYQYQLNDNLSITPGLIWLTAPNHNNDNKDIVIGTVRATFTF